MKILDTTFLIDYLSGVPATREFYRERGGETERWIIPVPAFAEVLVGEGNFPDGDVVGARTDLAWGETYAIDEQTAITAGKIADEVGPEGPALDGIDGLIAAVGRELDSPVVSSDSDLTHPETQRIIDVETYRE